MTSPALVLASRSPRRQQLLDEAGYRFEVDPADIDEDDLPPGCLPAEAALLLAARKARRVAERRPGDVVLGADTIVAFGDQLIGKPLNRDDAGRILHLLSGTTHLVITGLCLTHGASGLDLQERVSSAVRMKFMSPREIGRYLDSGQWAGKAGAYGIQDDDPFVTCISGSRSNVVGLPMSATRRLLAAAGIAPTPRRA